MYTTNTFAGNNFTCLQTNEIIIDLFRKRKRVTDQKNHLPIVQSPDTDRAIPVKQTDFATVTGLV